MKKNKAEWFKPALFTLQDHSVCTFTAGYTFPNLIAPFFPAGIADNQIYVWRNRMFYIKKPQIALFNRRISPLCCVTECFKGSWVIPTSPEAQPAAWVSIPALVLSGLVLQNLTKKLCSFTHSFFPFLEQKEQHFGLLQGETRALLFSCCWYFCLGKGSQTFSVCCTPHPSGFFSPPGKAQASNPRWMGPVRSMAQIFRGIWGTELCLYYLRFIFWSVLHSLSLGLRVMVAGKGKNNPWVILVTAVFPCWEFIFLHKRSLILSLWNQSALDASYWKKGSSQQWEEGIAPVVIQRKWTFLRGNWQIVLFSSGIK